MMLAAMMLADKIKRQARELGFDLIGIANAGPSQSHTRYTDWLARGHHGAMEYLARSDAVARRADVRALLPAARSVLVAAMNYYADPLCGPEPQLPVAAEVGRVARYAWGDDYHAIVADKLKQLVAFIEAEIGRPVAHKVCVDTSAVLEREWAVRAGLGWIGKNTMLINPRAGSWLVLGELLLDLELSSDAPLAADHCGHCARCIQACPTQCILPDRTLDARRCISYLTIELRAEIPADLEPFIGNWIFGCDVCQEVCPWNRFARPAGEPALAPRHARLNLRELMEMDEDAFRRRFARSAIRRAKCQGLVRNATSAAGHSRLNLPSPNPGCP